MALFLDHETHTYRNTLFPEKQYTSVTTFIGKFKTKFESELIAERVAKKNNKTKEEVLNEWKEIALQATTYGTEIHNLIEEWIKKKGFVFPTNPEHKEVIKELKQFNFLSAHEVLPEKILSLEDYNLAGTSDLILDYGDYFCIFDYKTNKKIHLMSDYNQWMNPPLDYLTDCSYTHYSLQMSIYAYMYSELTGKKLGNLRLLWWDRTNSKFVVYPVPYMREEVILMLKNYNI